jgi:hypothetical protein
MLRQLWTDRCYNKKNVDIKVSPYRGFLLVLFKDKCHLIFIFSVLYVSLRVKVTVISCNATFNDISAISLRSVCICGRNQRPRENHQPVASHWQTLLHIEYASSFANTLLLKRTDVYLLFGYCHICVRCFCTLFFASLSIFTQKDFL